MSLSGKVCLVTGATRGIGRGIAVQLGQAGAIVYITGRTLKSNDKGLSLEDTAKEIVRRGGQCVPLQCDHSKDGEVKAVFDTIEKDHNGQLDILVNNAYSAVSAIMGAGKKKFWELEPEMWDTVNNVGLRNHYFCSVYASRMMVKQKSGLIVNISSIAGLLYFFNVAYSVGKAGCDRMASDCAIELRNQGVAFVSLWPGAVKTETIVEAMKDQSVGKIFENGESTEFAGKCIVRLACDPDVMKKSGKILLSCDLADEYRIEDVDGSIPSSVRSVGYILSFLGYSAIGNSLPRWFKIPKWMFALGGNKF